MYFEGSNCAGLLAHDDHNRGVEYGFAANQAKRFNFINPDFYRVVPWEGAGLKPVGYGFDSVAATINMAAQIEFEADGAADQLAVRQQAILAADAKGLIATPKNSSYNELVQEAARLSILNDGDMAVIEYPANAQPIVKLRS
jgi:hypothetical protein